MFNGMIGRVEETEGWKAVQKVGDRVGEKVNDVLEDGYDAARRVARRSRHAAEDLLDETTHRIKRDPLRSVAITFSVGLGLGSAIGWLLAKRRR